MVVTRKSLILPFYDTCMTHQRSCEWSHHGNGCRHGGDRRVQAHAVGNLGVLEVARHVVVDLCRDFFCDVEDDQI